MAAPQQTGLLSPVIAEPIQQGSRASRPQTPVSAPVSPVTSRPSSFVGLPTIAERRGQSTGDLRIANGILHPPHMILPHQDGYRTPTGEDLENHFTSRKTRLKRAQNGGATSPKEEQNSFFYMRPASARSHLSISMMALSEKLDEKIEWKQRIRHFTWNFFSMNMATGGVANVLHSRMYILFLKLNDCSIQSVPYRFNGLDTIGTIFFLFNLCLFMANVTFISIRFIKWPETLKASVTHPSESLFMPSIVVSLGTILLNICQYGLGNVGSWLNDACLVLFWIYTCFAIIASTCTYLLMFVTCP